MHCHSVYTASVEKCPTTVTTFTDITWLCVRGGAYPHARACMLPRIVFVSSVDVDSSESCKYILIMAGQSVEASAEMLKNAVIDDPTAEHTATVGTLY